MSQIVLPPEPPALIQEYSQTPQKAILLGPAIAVENVFAQDSPHIRIVTKERDRGVKEYELVYSENGIVQSPNTNSPTIIEPISAIEIVADRQEYNEKEQVITASGNVVMRFSNAVLNADSLRVNLLNRLAVAEGKVVLKRGEQILRGERFEYFFFVDSGVIYNASGEIYIPTTSRDTSAILATDIPDRPLSDSLAENQPLKRVTAAEGYKFTIGSTRDLSRIEQSGGLPSSQTGGQIGRLRFEAQRIDFENQEWVATNMRITNDPFSPPELEVRADTARFRNIAPQVDELVTTNSRVVFDQDFTLPIFQDRLVFGRRSRQPTLVQFGFDGEERGGLYVERSFNLIDTENIYFKVTPQYFLQKALIPGAFGLSENETGDRNIFRTSAFGLKTRLNVSFSPRTQLQANTSLTSLNFNEVEDRLRANILLENQIGDLNSPHIFGLGYNYRDRIFNGSLGFQRVQSSVGAFINSPVIPIANSGINLNYQGSVLNINAETDRTDLIQANEGNKIINLTRYQSAASLSRSFSLWRGEALPPTKEEGLRYTPVPVSPFLQLSTGVTGVASLYSNGENQPSVVGSVGVQGQFGHFSRSFLDYTGFNILYTQGIRGDASPFKFDRFVDTRTLSLGISQQIYGPFRLGFQTSLNLDNSEQISTDYFLEYSRRTYNILLRYNPILSLGSISFRLSDFNWVGDPEPFGGSGIRPVTQGIQR
jgi:Protein of unknown function (DUF3769)/LptA/(LptD N-terminal domain) LPS transport protein